MNTFPQVDEWTTPLGKLAIGASLADLVLLPGAPFITRIEQQPVLENAEFVTTLPDGGLNLHANYGMIYVRTRQGLIMPDFPVPSAQTENESEKTLPATTDDHNSAAGRTIASPGVSQAARELSGLPGWLRPVSPLPWSGLSLADVEYPKAPGWLNPEPLASEDEPIENDEDDEPPFMAHGAFLE